MFQKPITQHEFLYPSRGKTKTNRIKTRYERRIAALIGARDVELVASARGDNHIVHCISVSNPGSLRTLNTSQKHRIANAHERWTPSTGSTCPAVS